MRTGASDVSTRGLRGQLRSNGRLEKARKARLRRSVLEFLEERTLLAVLPPVQVGGAIQNLSNDNNGAMSSPQVVVDRYNPNHLVSAWVENNTDNTNFQTFIRASYSIDGGANWITLNGTGIGSGASLIDTGAAPANPTVRYTQATSPQLAFDADHNLYMLSQQSNSGNTSGIVLLTKFNFTGNAPIQLGSATTIRQYTGGQDAITNLTLTVDDNQAAFTDPDTGAVQIDQYAGNVWIAWSTIETQPTGLFVVNGATWNPRSIQTIVSSDGGQTFSGANRLNIPNPGNAWTSPNGVFANATPKIAVAQGKANGAQGGGATVIWDNYGRVNTDFDAIQANPVAAGVASSKAGPGGPINQATDPGGGAPFIPGVTTFTTNVLAGDIDPRFLTLSNLTVDMTILQSDMSMLQAVLTAPNGTQIVLFRNLRDASGNVPNPDVARGITGANLGVVGVSNNVPYGFLGTTFDQNAARSISDRSGSAIGYSSTFRPDNGGGNNLSALNGLTAAQLTGTWTLTITDTRNNGTNPGPSLVSWGLNFTSGVTGSGVVNVASTAVRGSQTGSYSRASAAAGPQGIGPGIAISQDNTLGSFSQNQGRIYVTYVGYTLNQTGNPADNTDIYLVTSDDNGATWNYRGMVNDDQGSVDGFSGANSYPTLGPITGRAQFLPTVAVDQSTGTLVMSWRDARDDTARARSSIYLATSIDGGASFSAQTYANSSQTSMDAITRQQVVLSPEGDNFSGINIKPPTLFGFGAQMGLAVAGGEIYAAWTGNFNKAYLDASNVVQGYTFQTYVRNMTIAAGPRIVDSTMGVVGAPGDTLNTGVAPDGSILANTFTFTLDRRVDPASFKPSDVLVYFHDTVNTHGFVPLSIFSVAAMDTTALGATQFKVIFDPRYKPDGSSSNLNGDYVGTYSYIIQPTITDRIRSIVGGVLRTGNLVDQNSNAAAGQNPLTTAYTGLTPGDAYVAPMPAPRTPTTFGTDPLTLLAPPFSTSTLPLIVSGAHIASTQATNGSGGPDDLVFNNTTKSLKVTFDRDITASSFTAADVLQIMGPAGSVSGPQFFNSNATGQAITAPSAQNVPSTLNSKLSVRNFHGTFTATKVTVQLNISFPVDSGLTVNLIAPDGTKLELFNRVGNNGSNFINTIFDDAATNSITTGSAPFTGTFRPSGAGGLAVFNGKSIDGDWTLQVVNSRGGTVGTLNSWSLSVTPLISVTADAPVGGVARSFFVNFPEQSLSGTYTVQLASSILDTHGHALDSNLNAGLDVLRGQAANVPTTTVSFGSGNVNQSLVGGQIVSTINVPQNFPIQGITASGRTGIRLQLNLSTPNVTPLTATLIYHPGGGQQEVILFSGLTQGTSTGGFNATIFDDVQFVNGQRTTPIGNGSPTFSGTYNPQQPLLGFAGLSSGGTWQLLISGTGGATATLINWTLFFEKPLPTSGLGEPVADLANASFRIFQMNPTDPLSRDSWTAVGPAPIVNGATVGTGMISALAQDPSDPTGNTFYVGGANGGVWKTNNFLTTSPNGPTYVPLTDFGPSNGLKIGGIAVFGRNNDPNQSIVVASTGFGNTTTPNGTTGVGFLLSKDGGATWTLLDSTTNVDASGNPLPFDSPLRDRAFVGSTSFKVVVDPVAPSNGQVIIYAAISGFNGGVWRSTDTGGHWQLMRAGNATDVVLDPSSATGGDANLQIIYAGFQGDGVYLSTNRGQTWNLMTGGVGNPQIVDILDNQNVGVVAGPTPNGGHGRIVLAKPALTISSVENQIYAGWLYAAVTNPDSSFYGLFMTKDFGQNWVQVRIPTMPPTTAYIPATPTNDVAQSDYPLTGGPAAFQNITLAIDPNNANIVYLGGASGGGRGTGMIRIDATKVWDAHNLTTFSNVARDGAIILSSAGPVGIGAFNEAWSTIVTPFGIVPYPDYTTYLNYIRNPNNPFQSNSLLFVRNLTQFTNNGFGATWTPFDAPDDSGLRAGNILSYDQLFTMVDPVTGLTRVVFGTGQGIWSVLDDHGAQLNGSSVGTQPTPGANRNGNLQITQFFYGSAQPSNVAVAASFDHSLFYGGSFGNQAPSSDGSVLNNGNLDGSQTAADPFFGYSPNGTLSYGSATDQQGNGTLYQSFQPGSLGTNYGTTFFQVNHISRTFGLFQQSGGSNAPDPQWPIGGLAPFTVNPVSGDQIMISSAVGRIFATENQGVTWFEIGGPAIFGNPGNFSVALAYGAPDPSVPGGRVNLGDFMYVGTSTGQVYMTRTAGGGDGSSWFNISLGLDGSLVKQIVTNPARGSHSAYAVTTTGVFFIRDSVALAQNPTNAAAAWIKVTGNLQNLSYTIFGQPYQSSTGTNPLSQTQTLNAIAADWRYTIPNAAADPAGAGFHPVLYVAGDSGVFRSLDNGLTWTLFPDRAIDGAVDQGGFLPRTNITDLDLSVGNIDPTTGMSNLAPGDPDVLLATTYGRGSFAIKVAPLVLPGTVRVNPADVNGDAPDGSPIVTTGRFRLNGLSSFTGFGNSTRITIFDVTDNKLIGGYDPSDPATDNAANWTDSFGNFNITMNNRALATNGLKVLQIYATDDAGAVGNVVTLTITLDASDLNPSTVPINPTLKFNPADITGIDPNHIYTNHPQPTLSGVTSPSAPGDPVTVELLYKNGAGAWVSFSPPVLTTADANGRFTFTFPALGDGTYTVEARASNNEGPALSPSAPVVFTIKTNPPTLAPTLLLNPYFDSGIVGDNITNVRKPFLYGTIGAANAGSVIRVYVADANGNPSGAPLAQTTADSSGNFSAQLPFSLSNGQIRLVATAVDAASNPAPGPSGVLKLTFTSVPMDYSGSPIDYYSSLNPPRQAPVPQYAPSETVLYYRNAFSGKGDWYDIYAPWKQVPTWFTNFASQGGASTDIPLTGDFDGDGKADLVSFNRSNVTWTISSSTGMFRGAFPFGYAGVSLPVVGNFDGPGATQFGAFSVFNNVGYWSLTSARGVINTYTFGVAGDVPLTGDFDGVGYDQIAVYRPSTGQFIVFVPTGGGPNGTTHVIATMAPNQIPVPGQYDNLYAFQHGLPYKTEAAVFDPNTGVFTIARPAGSAFPSVIAFQPGDIPTPGDYQGYGWIAPGVYRPSTGQFLIKTDQTQAASPDFQISIFAGGVGYPLIPVAAPLSYRMLGSGGAASAAAPRATAQATSADVVAAEAVLADQTSTASAPTPSTSAPAAPAVVAPSVGYASSNDVGTRQPWFIGTAAPGIVVDFFLNGKGVVGNKKVGSANVDANGAFYFQLPAGARNGAYTLLVAVRGGSGSALTPIASTTFQIAPPASRPLIRKAPAAVNVGRAARPTLAANPKPAAVAPRAVSQRPVVARPAAAAAVAAATTSVFDQAIQNLHKNRLSMRNES